MDCMNVLCVHVAQHLVQVIGGIPTNTWACSAFTSLQMDQ